MPPASVDLNLTLHLRPADRTATWGCDVTDPITGERLAISAGGFEHGLDWLEQLALAYERLAELARAVVDPEPF